MNRIERGWTVADVMVDDVLTVSPETPYKQLVEALWTRGVSGLPVVDAVGRLVGVVSESDLLAKQEHPAGEDTASEMRRLAQSSSEEWTPTAYRALADLSKAMGRTAADVMTSPALSIGPDASLTTAASLLHRRGLKRLPVVDGEGRLVGIISRADLLKVFLRSDDEIRRDVLANLTASGVTADMDRISVNGGVVTLESDLADEPGLRQIEEVAGAVDGVVGVRRDTPRMPSPGMAG